MSENVMQSNLNEESLVQLSLVSPVYRASLFLDDFVGRVDAALKALGVTYEIILVDDGSPDDSWSQIVSCKKRYPAIKGVKLSRNFGQHVAIAAGLQATRAEFVVTMDCDMQDNPSEIAKLYARAQEGFDVVVAHRENRKDDSSVRIMSRIFYWTFNKLAGVYAHPKVGTFQMLSRKVVLYLNDMKESSRYYGGLVQWLGFPSSVVEVEHGERIRGKSGYTLKKKIDFAVTVILAFSNKPLKLSIAVGFLFFIFAIILVGVLVFQKLFFGVPVQGYTSIVVSLYMIGGVILMNLGLVGVYLGRLYDEVKGRPMYVVDERV